MDTTAIRADEAFAGRLAAIPRYGLGLSVDLYSPELAQLVAALAEHRLSYGYLEIFKGTTSALQQARAALPGVPLAYHGEGLWVTQPDLTDDPAFESELGLAADHVRALDAAWLNHECATKQIAGRVLGTYLPPLFTPESAALTARQATLLQARLDALSPPQAPLLLLETPPLTYFALGTIDVAAFFAAVAARAACGLVLDLGHLWTIFRYTAARRQSLESFTADFLDRFPLERVVQIHVAGLGPHPRALPEEHPGEPPRWLDAHDRPIPGVLFDLLERVLQHPRLRNLRGVALEVDNKSVAQTVREFAYVLERFQVLVEDRMRAESGHRRARRLPPLDGSIQEADESEPGRLRMAYRRYLDLLLGRAEPDGTDCAHPAAEAGLRRYRRECLGYEILEWGGCLRDMFPETCRRLAAAGVELEPFVEFWFRDDLPRGAYDFFRLKVDRFAAYAGRCLPAAVPIAEAEAERLREGYALACE